jgi:hypothetical protein
MIVWNTLLVALERAQTPAGPFGRAALPIDKALQFIAAEDIFWAIG